MSKILVAVLLAAMVLSLAACGAKTSNTDNTDTTTVNDSTDTVAENTDAPDVADVTGAWTEPEDGTVTDELKAIFDKATESLTGVGYTPVKLLGTQVVAGTNYKFLAAGTAVTPDAEEKQYEIVIYADLEGNATVENIEEVSAEVNMTGAWTEPEDGTVTDELKAIFDKATESLTGVGYTPVKLLGTQVVAGTNYKFLAAGTAVTPDAEEKQYEIIIYADLEGNATVENIEEVSAEVNMTGAWTEPEDGTVTDELKAIFDKATESLTGVGYTPVKLLGTQVVAGTNYKFLATGTTVTPDAETKEYTVVIYVDLEGNASVTSVE